MLRYFWASDAMNALPNKESVLDPRGVIEELLAEPLSATSGAPDQNSSAKILEALRTYGHAYVKQPLSFDDFKLISKSIGTIQLETDIKVDAALVQFQNQQRIMDGRPSTYQSQGLDFHSDNPRINVLAWYCREQDEVDGALYLIDTDSVAGFLTQAELEILTKTNVMYSNLQSGADKEKELLKEPVLTAIGSGYHVYYQSWLLRDKYTAEQVAALSRFSEYIKAMQKTSRIRVRLEKSQSLFIDNRRTLHGRASLAPDTRRHLIRFFLTTPDLRA
jgi:hypothetical protein